MSMRKFGSMLAVCMIVSLLAGCIQDVSVDMTIDRETELAKTGATDVAVTDVSIELTDVAEETVEQEVETEAEIETVVETEAEIETVVETEAEIETVVETEPVITAPVELTEPVVSKPVANEPSVNNHIKSVPDGNAIHLDISFMSVSRVSDFIYPIESDFGEYFDKAVTVYDAIMSGVDMVEIRFDVDGVSDCINDVVGDVCDEVHRQWDEFASIFNRVVLRDMVSLNAYHASYYSGRITVWTSRVVSDLNKSVTNFKAYYDANLSAGLYDGMSEKAAVMAINKWICDHMSYSVDNADPIVAITTGVGCCAAYAGLFEGMCNNAGIICQKVIGYAVSNAGSGSHAWNRVSINGIWYYVDTCWNDTCGDNTAYLFSETLWASHSI